MNIRSRRQQQLIYLITDAISAVAIWLCFLVFRWLVYEGRIFNVDNVIIPAFNFYPPLFLYPLGCLLVYYASGYYMNPMRRNLVAEFTTTLMSAIVISLSAFFVIIINDAVDSYEVYLRSFMVLFCLQLVLSYIPRLIITLNTRRRTAHGQLARRTYIVGEGDAAQQVVEMIQRQPQEYKLISIINRDQLLQMIADNNLVADTVIIAYDNTKSEQELYDIISHLFPLQVEICYTPRLFDVVSGNVRINSLDDSPIVNISDLHTRDYVLSIKRLFDVVASASALIVLSPLLLIIALSIKLTSKGAVIYKQERIGHYGKAFEIYKFRTMIDHAEGDTPQLTLDHDPRITSIGKWLRQYRLDELPQLWNVFIGDMSIVGPRPEREFFIRQIMQQAPYYCLIYKLRPGLTSWGPIKVGYTDTIEKMIQRTNYDIIYMENLSLRLDMKIMLHTISVIVKGKGK